MAHLRSNEGVATLKKYGGNWPSVLMVYSGIHGFIDPPTKTCQNGSQNPCNETDEGDIYNMNEVQNPYKLTLNPELTVFTEKPDESASTVIIAYQHRFDHNR